jgi:PhnB protein
MKIDAHIVVRDAARAADWYARALGAEERSRIPLPGGKLMSVELAFGESTVMVADEFPEAGILSPLSIGGTATVLNITTDGVDSLWQRALDAGAEVLHPLEDAFWATATGRSPIRSGTAGVSPSTSATSPMTRWSALPRRRSAGRAR